MGAVCKSRSYCSMRSGVYTHKHISWSLTAWNWVKVWIWLTAGNYHSVHQSIDKLLLGLFSLDFSPFCLDSVRQLQACMMTWFYLFYLSSLMPSLKEPEFMSRFVSLQPSINHWVYGWNGAHSQTVRQPLVALIHWDSSRAVTGFASYRAAVEETASLSLRRNAKGLISVLSIFLWPS